MQDSDSILLPLQFSSFSDIDRLHRLADRLLIQHQSACMNGNWEEALHRLELLYELRMQNITDEEEFLLPLYQSSIAEIPKGGAVKLYKREHKLIRKHLKAFIRDMSDIVMDESGNTVNLVELFEKYHDFKDLLDHHDSRERVFLFKMLDEGANAGTKREILDKINIRQAALSDKFGMTK